MTTTSSRGHAPGIYLAYPSATYDPLVEARRNSAIVDQLQRCVSSDRAASFILLAAPNGTIYKLVVANDGTLSTTAF